MAPEAGVLVGHWWSGSVANRQGDMPASDGTTGVNLLRAPPVDGPRTRCATWLQE